MSSTQISELAITEMNPDPFFILLSLAPATTLPSTRYFILSPEAIN
jgi:hypothetical protein